MSDQPTRFDWAVVLVGDAIAISGVAAGWFLSENIYLLLGMAVALLVIAYWSVT